MTMTDDDTVAAAAASPSASTNPHDRHQLHALILIPRRLELLHYQIFTIIYRNRTTGASNLLYFSRHKRCAAADDDALLFQRQDILLKQDTAAQS